MLERFRYAWAAFLTPVARFLLRCKLTPDLVTVTGTVAVVVAAAVLLPRGWLWQGAVVLGVLVITDSVDGQMAKISNSSTTWGAFLDSSLDRLADAAVFGGLVIYFAGRGHSLVFAAVALWALVWGQVTSYVKARAESLGLKADGGIAARADRLVFIFVAMFISGLGVPYVLQVAISMLAVASTITVVQRMAKVRRQTRVAA